MGINRRAFEVGGDPPLPDAFGDRGAFGAQFAVGIVVVQRRAVRIGERDADVLVERLQPKTHARNRPARARGAGETIHAAAELLPDFRRSAFDMGAAVGDVVELVGPDCAGGFFGQTA